MDLPNVPARPVEIKQIQKKSRPWAAWLIIAGGTGLLAVIMAFSVTRGAAEIPLASVWNALFHFNAADTQHLIVMDLRLPRVLASALVGASFAVAGAVMQGVTCNPMADSGLMGLNAGAGFALSLCFAFFPELAYLQVILFSFIGAAIGAGGTYGIASLRRGGATPMRLVLAGAAVSALLAALSQGIALYFDVAQNIMFWTAGGVAGSNWEQIRILTPLIAGALLGSIALSRSISIMSLGEDAATGLGLNTMLVKLLCAAVVLMLAGASVAVVGAVGFVGLIVPHLARFLVGMDYSLIIPSSAVTGSLLVVLADLGARTLNPPFETPIGALIALIGVPFFLYLARKERREL
ncbi:FecCD family ABC transporter permease [Acetonema longum]|uniref:Ferrichrome ABC transporter, permease protein FhuB n=1 Tax=Acetonema longum DSM 6540 TaxID=1009370 RepID=F7NN48_9FIRM|nr:iron chelate uptake ABC transporter family permease subunit [Acetonema longum]EGO62514.1 ferrichrome ABC transporter, permease protein FhuB [Acetonema longum DSM 6540]